MTPRLGWAGGIALLFAGCALAQTSGEAARELPDLPLAPYAEHQDCVGLAPGDRLDYAYDSATPVSFGIYYRTGRADVAPISREASLSDAGVFVVALAQTYCLRWEAGREGTVLAYRLRVRRGEAP